MIVSTKGRYALRVMIDLAAHNDGSFVPLAEIAERQGISEKYLEGIMAVLSKHGFVNAQRGRGGGYKLARSPEDYTVWSILTLIEGPLVPVSCLENEVNNCERAAECRTLPMWSQLSTLIRKYLEGVPLADLLVTDAAAQYVI